ncbi:MAG: hypothetical protein AB1704_41970, partial [Pseudomonadota bacterium]
DDRSFRKPVISDHLRPKRPITINRNHRSRSTEIADHVRRNTQSNANGKRNRIANSGIPFPRIFTSLI